MRIIEGSDERRCYWVHQFACRGFERIPTVDRNSNYRDWEQWRIGRFTAYFYERVFESLVPAGRGPVVYLCVFLDGTLKKGAWFRLLDVEDSGIHRFLDCLIQPWLLSTCVGIPGVDDFLEVWLREQ